MLFRFFVSCNKIGAFTLGGGYAMIPVMEHEFVEKNQWLTKREFVDILLVAQSSPGIFSAHLASYTGYKMKGIWGGIVGAVGITLPSIVVITLIAMFFRTFKDNIWVEKFFRGVRPAVVALIASPCFKLAESAGINRYNFWIPVLSVLLIWLLGVSPILIILAAGLLGFLWGKFEKREDGQ